MIKKKKQKNKNKISVLDEVIKCETFWKQTQQRLLTWYKSKKTSTCRAISDVCF